MIHNIFCFKYYNKKYIKIYKIYYNKIYNKIHIIQKGEIKMGYDVIMRGINDTALIRIDGGDAIVYEVGYFGARGDFNKYAEYIDSFEGAYKHFKSLGNNKQINIKKYYIYANVVYGTIYFDTLEELKANASAGAIGMQELQKKMIEEGTGTFYLAVGIEFEDQDGNYGGLYLISKKDPNGKFNWSPDVESEGIDIPKDLKSAMQDLINTLQ